MQHITEKGNIPAIEQNAQNATDNKSFKLLTEIRDNFKTLNLKPMGVHMCLHELGQLDKYDNWSVELNQLKSFLFMAEHLLFELNKSEGTDA